MTAALANFAAAEYQRRQGHARRAVAAGEWSVNQATARLRPWLAIACLAGADLPDLDEGLAGFARDIADENTVADFVRRDSLAGEICARRIWSRELARARDVVIAASSPDDRPEALDRTRGLIALARHFAIDPNRFHPVPPFLADELAQQGTAA